MDDLKDRLLAHALGYARRGIAVFPCDPATKRPKVKHGFKEATHDPAVIRAWWSQWPTAMIGAATGRVSGFFAVDLDVNPSEGKEGVAAWAQLCADHASFPITVNQVTPSGGVHHYFRHPDRPRLAGRTLGNRANRPAFGIDVRGDGGYVILPPSERTDGRAYAWAAYESDEARPTLADAPDWLLAAICKEPPAPAEIVADGDKVIRFPTRRRGAEIDAHASAPKGARYAAAALQAEYLRVARSRAGARGSNLNAAAFNLGQLIGTALRRGEVEARLLQAAQLCGVYAKDGHAQTMDRIARGIEAGMQKPRGGAQ